MRKTEPPEGHELSEEGKEVDERRRRDDRRDGARRRSETQDLWVEDETMRVNLGPQHPSTHGVLRLRTEVSGEVIVDVEPIIGYLHTGIEKQAETLNWIQAVTDVTRADYLSNFYNELAYCLAVEKLAGIEAPPRAQWIRMLMCEFNRMSSHLVWLATGGMELGALSMATFAFRERETILDFYQAVTGLRMNHAYFRPGGVNMDLRPEHIDDGARAARACSRSASPSTRTSSRTTRSGCGATRASACITQGDAIAYGVTGPNLRAAGVAHDLRKKPKPYLPVRPGRVRGRRSARTATATTGTSSGCRSCTSRRRSAARRSTSSRTGRSARRASSCRRRATGSPVSMEAVIHHFKLFTDGPHVPAGEVYVPVESRRAASSVTSSRRTDADVRGACTSADRRSATCRSSR